MIEIPRLLPTTESLKKAINVTKVLYVGDLHAMALDHTNFALMDVETGIKLEQPAKNTPWPEILEKRNILWSEMAQNYPDHSVGMLELRGTIYKAYEKYHQYPNPKQKREEMRVLFSRIKNVEVRSLLADLLISRSKNQNTNYSQEAKNMIGELGFDIYNKNQIENTTMSLVIGNILIGNFRLAVT